MKHIHPILSIWLPPLGYMLAIFFVSSVSHPQLGGQTPDYVLHALEYFLLALLLMRVMLTLRLKPFQNMRPLPEADTLKGWHLACLAGFGLTVGYGLTDEWHQYFVPGRHCSLQDVGADTVGALLAYGIASLDYFVIHRAPAWIRRIHHSQLSRQFSYAAYRLKNS